MNKMSHSILDTIGNTPLIEINTLNPNPKVKILAKLEYFNPGGSVKDRIALFMIEDGEKSGKLTLDKTVIEATSGNTGIGLALVCSVKGYKLLLTMSEAVSVERQKILKARGADILLTPGHLGTDGAIEEAYRLARENSESYFMTDQFNNEANWQAHYFGTAEEIWKDTDGKVDIFVAGVGTGGTITGVGEVLKNRKASVKVVAIEPADSPVLSGGEAGPHMIQGIGAGFVPGVLDMDIVDEVVQIGNKESFGMAKRLAKEEGILAGISSGAAAAAAAKVAKREENAGKLIVVVLPDTAERYLSTELFS